MKTRDELTQKVVGLLPQVNQETGRHYTWREIKEELYKNRPDISAALIWKVVNNPHYQPGPAVCARLGMIAPVEMYPCPIHSVVHDYDCQTHAITPKCNPRPRAYRDLFAMPAAALQRAIECREDY